MDQRIDFFQEVQRLIEREKEQALRRFRRLDPHRLITAESGTTGSGAGARARRFRPAAAWSAAGLVVAAGALLLLMLYTTSRMNPVRPSWPYFLAQASLFGSQESFPLTMGPFPSGDSPLRPVLESMAVQAGPGADAQAGRLTDRNGEYVSPAGVMSKIEKIIRERTLERLIARFYHISEEV